MATTQGDHHKNYTPPRHPSLCRAFKQPRKWRLGDGRTKTHQAVVCQRTAPPTKAWHHLLDHCRLRCITLSSFTVHDCFSINHCDLIFSIWWIDDCSCLVSLRGISHFFGSLCVHLSRLFGFFFEVNRLILWTSRFHVSVLTFDVASFGSLHLFVCTCSRQKASTTDDHKQKQLLLDQHDLPVQVGLSFLEFQISAHWGLFGPNKLKRVEFTD